MKDEAEQIMKRCQVGTRNYDEANNLHAACYGLIGKLSARRQWVGLTGPEKALIASVSLDVHDAVHRTDAKLKEKNT